MTGGEDAAGHPCRQAEALEIATGHVHPIPPMRTVRRFHGSAASDNHLFVFGGVQGTRASSLHECEIFNPDTET